MGLFNKLNNPQKLFSKFNNNTSIFSKINTSPHQHTLAQIGNFIKPVSHEFSHTESQIRHPLEKSSHQPRSSRKHGYA
jgi:hypothetical protein